CPRRRDRADPGRSPRVDHGAGRAHRLPSLPRGVVARAAADGDPALAVRRATAGQGGAQRPDQGGDLAAQPVVGGRVGGLVGGRRHRPEHYDGYSHVVVDEAQGLAPMQWRMIGRRGRYASWTVVGDPVQSSWPKPEEADLAAADAFGKATRRRFALRTNYRNSAEIFALASRVVAEHADPDQLPEAVRHTGIEPDVREVDAESMADEVRRAAKELLAAVDGTVGVISAMDRVGTVEKWLAAMSDDRLRVVGSLDAKGLEYDAVVLLEPR